MAISLLRNPSSAFAQSRLSEAGQEKASIFQRLSTGLKINNAFDDAAALSVSSMLKLDSRVNRQGIRNANDTVSVFNIVDDTLSTLNSIVARQLEIAHQAASGTLSSEQRATLQEENSALQDEYERILTSAEYNGKQLFASGRGTADIEAGGDGVELDYRALGFETTGLGSYAINTSTLGLEDNAASILVSDLNNDGYQDVVIGMVKGNLGSPVVNFSVYTFHGSASGLSQASSTTFNTATTSFDGADFAYLDFTGSGNNVALYAGYKDNGSGYTRKEEFTIDSAGLVTGHNATGFTATTNSLTEIADFNGDGVDDYVDFNISQEDFQTYIQDTTQTVGFASLSQGTLSVSSQSNALSAITTLTELQTTISNTQSVAGGSGSRLQAIISNLNSKQVETDAAYARITDIDTAEEVSHLVAANVKTDAASSILAQANLQPTLVLQLIGASPPAT